MTSLVSVLIPVYNPNLEFFKQSIESILNQTYKNLEIIIILEKSNSELDVETEKILQNYNDSRIVVLRKNHVGAAHARNLGIKKSKGEYIALMDADDISDKTRFEKQINFFNRHPKADIVGTYAKIIDAENNDIGILRFPLEPKDIRRTILVSIPFVHASTMFKKELISRGGSYSESFPTSEDYEFFIRQTANGAIGYNIDDPLYIIREHPQSLNRRMGLRFGYFYVSAKIKGIRCGFRKPRDLFYFLVTLPVFFFTRKTTLFVYRRFGKFFSRSLK